MELMSEIPGSSCSKPIHCMYQSECNCGNFNANVNLSLNQILRDRDIRTPQEQLVLEIKEQQLNVDFINPCGCNIYVPDGEPKNCAKICGKFYQGNCELDTINGKGLGGGAAVSN